jgi:hypothetical protein
MATGGNWSLGWQVLPGEFNGDGVPDLLLYNRTTGAYCVALRSGDAFYTLKGAWSTNLSLTLTDLNGDGVSDVVAYAPTLGTWGAAVSTSRPATFIQTGGLFSKSLTVLAEHRRQP